MTTMSEATQVEQSLRDRGYIVVEEAGHRGLVEVIEQLGQVLHVEEVVVQAEARSLVKSDRGLSLHTDHHRADIIVWHCIAQSDEGGDTILADALAALRRLTTKQQAALTHVLLKEHNVFADDDDLHPVLTLRDGRPRIYYSYWLASDDLGATARSALDAFACAVAEEPTITLRLRPGDVLAIDNGRMLHGRSAIGGSRSRHLRRYWLASASR